MGLFDRIFRRSANTNVEAIVAEPGESFIIGAERAADIITQGIEKGDLFLFFGEYSCSRKPGFRSKGNQRSGSGNHLRLA